MDWKIIAEDLLKRHPGVKHFEEFEKRKAEREFLSEFKLFASLQKKIDEEEDQSWKDFLQADFDDMMDKAIDKLEKILDGNK